MNLFSVTSQLNSFFLGQEYYSTSPRGQERNHGDLASCSSSQRFADPLSFLGVRGRGEGEAYPTHSAVANTKSFQDFRFMQHWTVNEAGCTLTQAWGFCYWELFPLFVEMGLHSGENIPSAASLSLITLFDLGKVLCELESSLVKWGPQEYLHHRIRIDELMYVKHQSQVSNA